MARCKNCGWDNPDNATKCEKCGSSLSQSQNIAAPSPEGTFASKTVRESAAFGGNGVQTPNASGAMDGTVPEGTVNVCPKCGYPMRPGVTECPQCGYSASATKVETKTERDTNRRPVSPVNSGGKDVHGTAPIWGAGGMGNSNVFITCQCTLSPVPIPGVPTPNDLVVEDDSIELNRQNLDPKNTSISRELQAMLTYENGKWYIQDKSSQHTTFVYAGDKIELKDGDKILMGGIRLFEFKEG